MLKYFAFKWTTVENNKEKNLHLDFPQPVMSKVSGGNQIHLLGFFLNQEKKNCHVCGVNQLKTLDAGYNMEKPGVITSLVFSSLRQSQEKIISLWFWGWDELAVVVLSRIASHRKMRKKV